MRLIFTLSFLLLSQSIWAQSGQSTFRIAGEAKTNDGAVIPGLSLSVEKDGKPFERNGYGVGAFSDINGRFTFELPVGDYKITAAGIPENDFRLFLNIPEEGARPERLEIPIDASGLCSADGESLIPKNVVIPNYPPAARAVRAMGTVSVVVNIRPDGSVSEAKAVSGHPLLRKAAENGGAAFTFEPSNEDAARKSTLRFIFLDPTTEEKGLKRFGCPQRILIIAEPVTIEQTTSH